MDTTTIFVSKEPIPVGEDPYDYALATIEGEKLPAPDGRKSYDRDEAREALEDAFALIFDEPVVITFADETEPTEDDD